MKISYRKFVFQTIATELYKQLPKTKKKHIKLVSTGVDVVLKIDDEVYVLWGLCIIFSFVFCCAKEGRVAECNESDVGTLKILRQEEIVDKIVDKKRMNFLVNLYCSLLFSRKEIIKFTEVALV